MHVQRPNTHPRISLFTHFRKLLPASLWDLTVLRITPHMFKSSEARPTRPEIKADLSAMQKAFSYISLCIYTHAVHV